MSSSRSSLLSILFMATVLSLVTACGGSVSAPSTEQSSGEQSSGEQSSVERSSEETTDGGEFPVTVTDSVGREVTIESEPEDIASMAPSITETLFAVGAGDRVVGVTTADDYPEEVTEIETVGDYVETNIEKVLELETDLLLVSFDTNAERADELAEQTNASVVVVDPGTLDEVLSSVELVARAAGEPENGQELRSEMRSEMDGIEEAVAGEPEPTVFYEVYGDPLQTVGPGSFIDDAISVAGGENIAANTEEAYPTYSAETLIQRDPYYYLVGSLSGATPEKISERPGFENLSAVNEGRIETIDDDLISRPGPRIVDGVRQMAEAIHPESF